MNPLGSAGTAHDGFVNRRVGSSSLPVGSGENRSKLAGPRTEPERGTTFVYSFLGARAEPGGSARLGMREPATTGRCLRLTGQLSSRTEDHDPAAANRRDAFDANRSTGIRYRSRDRELRPTLDLPSTQEESGGLRACRVGARRYLQ